MYYAVGQTDDARAFAETNSLSFIEVRDAAQSTSRKQQIAPALPTAPLPAARPYQRCKHSLLAPLRERKSVGHESRSRVLRSSTPARLVGCRLQLEPFFFAPRSVRRPLLTLQVNPGSLYRCSKSD